jgi:hypothetical protein
LVLLACGGDPPPEPAQVVPAPADTACREFVVYSLWFEGQGEEDRAELDAFTECLLTGSTFPDFWGNVCIRSAGSWTVEPPPVADDAVGAITAHLERLALPDPPPGTTPIYVTYGHPTHIGGTYCGQSNMIEVKGRPAGLARVRTGLPCWPAQPTTRSLTQFTQHEVSAVIELALGEDHCAADGACEANTACPDPCDTFTGLYCEGAPEQSYTGCDGSPVRGWVVQKLSSKGQGTQDCPLCGTCDFTTRASQ